MTTGNVDKADMTVPAPLVLGKLREHFRRTYLLNETQVETMVVSSSKSLHQALDSAHEVLGGKEPESRFVLIFHSLKGLLLNMGEPEWAAYTRELEQRLTDGEQLDYGAVIGIIETGLAEVLSYEAEPASESGS